MPPRSYLIELHIAVLLLGATALFGKLVSLPAVSIIVGRSAFTVMALIFVMFFLKISFRLSSRQQTIKLSFTGFLLALHWCAFFASILMSTVAIGVLGFATYPMFVTLLEPIFFNERLQKKDVLSGLGVFTGLLLMVPEWEIENTHTIALLIAVLSGFLLAIFTILNRKLVKQHHFLQITFYQHLSAGACMLPFAMWWSPIPNGQQWALLALLGVAFTAIPQALLVRCLNHLKAHLVSISVGLEPVYSILLAMLLLSEFPTLNIVIGGGVIMVSVFYASITHNQRHRALQIEN